jgi:hypothetical protein
MYKISKGDKLLFVEVKGYKITTKEWVTVERTGWDNEASTPTVEILLSNNKWFYDGDGAKTSNDNTIVNHFYHDSYEFLSTSEKDCYSAMISHLSNQRAQLLQHAKDIEKDADKLDTVVMAVRNVINESSLKFKV